MTYLGVYKMPVIGEVGPDGKVTFDPAFSRNGTIQRFKTCRRCRRKFATDEDQDYWTTCDDCTPR